jgi:sensor domain CHASE-containing protein
MKNNSKNLSIRSKVVISVFLLTTILTLIFYFIATQIILKSYLVVESDVVEINIQRVNYAIKDIEKNQVVKLRDWASWDDTYNFVKDLNKDYIDNNLQISSLVNLDVNFMTFVDKEGNIIFNKVIDLEKKEELRADELTSTIGKQSKILTHKDIDNVISGIIETPYGLALVSSGPVLNSDGVGPINGTLILGNFLNKNITQKIGDSILYPVDVFDYNDKLTEDLTIAKDKLSNGSRSFVQVLSDDSVAGYSLVYNLEKKAVAITKITLPRYFYEKGRDSFYIFTMIIAIMLLSFGLGIIILLEKLIIYRFTLLNKKFSEISASKDLTQRIPVDKDDEIGNLSTVINNLFNDLSIAQEKEKESDKLEKIATENMKKHMEETEKLNKLMINRELTMIELKKKVEELEKSKNN